MSNEITSMLQPITLHNRTPGQLRGGSQPTVVEKPANAPGDRLSLTDSARLLQMTQAKPGQNSTPRPDAAHAGLTYARADGGFGGKEVMMSPGGQQTQRGAAIAVDQQEADIGVQTSTNRPPNLQHAQRPSPQMSNMMESFFMTSDMEGFNASSDLNADGVVNFQDLAALKAKEAKGEPIELPAPVTHLEEVTSSFFTSEGSQGFDAATDFNNDGMVNFQDLAVLRAKMESADSDL